jgi:hypothetical protein
MTAALQPDHVRMSSHAMAPCHGMEQVEYEFWIADKRVGYMRLIVPTHWIALVEVLPSRRGIGLGKLIHALVADRHDGWLTLAPTCAQSEERVIASLVRDGWLHRRVSGITGSFQLLGKPSNPTKAVQ